MNRSEKSIFTRSLTKTPYKGGANPFVKMLNSTRTNTAAKLKGYDISYTDVYNLWVLQDGKCAITNIPMIKDRGFPDSMSVDRINNSLGYVSTNIRLVCRQINLMKNTLSDDEVFLFINKIIKFY